MSQLIPEFQDYKNLIPEFIVKLYHILEKKQYQDYLCWNGDDQVLIKSGKKLQEKVLPHFFRHKHLSSFIRQLNMYKFNKVAKLTKQRNHMYFKNEFFQRNKMYLFISSRKQLTKIKRNNKKNRNTTNQLPHSIASSPDKSVEEDDVSLMNEISQENQALANYKGEVRKSFMEIKEILAKVMQKYPQTLTQLKSAKLICDEVMECQERDLSEENNFESYSQEFEKNDINNMLTTEKNIPRFEAPMYVSRLSDFNFM